MTYRHHLKHGVDVDDPTYFARSVPASLFPSEWIASRVVHQRHLSLRVVTLVVDASVMSRAKQGAAPGPARLWTTEAQSRGSADAILCTCQVIPTENKCSCTSYISDTIKSFKSGASEYPGRFLVLVL